MPRYFFHIRRHDALVEDAEGVELPSNTAALEEAIGAARELLAGKVRSGDFVDGDRFEVRDEHGQVVHTLPFRLDAGLRQANATRYLGPLLGRRGTAVTWLT